MTLTADDRVLLREVFRAARRKGWRRLHGDPEYSYPGSRYWADDRNTIIELNKHGWLETDVSQVDCLKVELAVDVLVAIDVLPAHLSSTYKAGHADGHTEAYYGGKTQYGIRRVGFRAVRITSEQQGRSLLRNWVMPGELVTREISPWQPVREAT
jgi:hypothetical protein